MEWGSDESYFLPAIDGEWGIQKPNRFKLHQKTGGR
jgi:hypothetical protein